MQDYFLSTKTNNEIKIPPICKRIIRHMLNDDEESIQHFFNWLAVAKPPCK